MSGTMVSPFPDANALFNVGDVYKTVNDIQTGAVYRNALLQKAENDAATLELERGRLRAAQELIPHMFPPDGAPVTGATPPVAAPGSGSPGGGFQLALGNAESGNQSTRVNPYGYSGQYQFGAPRLKDLGFYEPAEGEDLKANQWKGTFRIPPFNVTTHAQFLANPAAQHAVFRAHVANIDQAIAGIPGAQGMDQNGLRAVAHLGGVDGMRRFIETRGLYNPKDANGTSLSDYYKRFAEGGPAALQAAFGSPDATRQGGPGAAPPPPAATPTTAALPTPPIPPDEVPPPPVAPSRAALRTGGTDFAGPGVPAGPAPDVSPVTPAAAPVLPSPFVSMVPGGAPVAPPQATLSGPQPAVTALPPQLPPQVPPSPPVSGPTPQDQPAIAPDYTGLVAPPETLRSGPGVGLTARQYEDFRLAGLLALSSKNPTEALMSVRQQMETARNANTTAERNYQTDKRQRETDAEARSKAAYDRAKDASTSKSAADKATSDLDNQKFNWENTYRDEFQTLTKEFRVVQNSYENVLSAAKAQDGPGDMSLIYNYVRLLDPTSVVRETEADTAAASGSAMQRAWGIWERFQTGGRLPEELRQSFIRESRNLYRNRVTEHDAHVAQYEELARERGLNPRRVVTKFKRLDADPPDGGGGGGGGGVPPPPIGGGGTVTTPPSTAPPPDLKYDPKTGKITR